MPTIKDVAQYANVSISTVSRVINNSAPVEKSKYEAVQSAMKRLGYCPNPYAQALVRQYTNTLGLLMTDQPSYALTRMLSSINTLLYDSNKRLLLEVNDDLKPEQEMELITRLLSSECDTFIVMPKHISNQDLLSLIKEKLVIILGRQVETIPNQCIAVDELDVGYRATNYLTQLNHKKIGFIGSNVALEVSKLREMGYVSAMNRRNLSNTLNYIQYNIPSFQGGYAAANILVEQNPGITALIVHNDIMASGVLSALKHAGKKMPQDISVLACEDSGISKYLSPALTALRYPIEEMVEAAVCLALRQVNRKNYTTLNNPPSLSFLSRLLIRDSVIACSITE